MKSKKYTTLFLDRDGVINEKIDGYVKTYLEFKFIDGVLESLKYLSEYFEKIIIVTNQQGIGKKLMTSDDLDSNYHNYMVNEINISGGRIDKIYHCPCLESENCECRKPNSGMLLEAKNDFPSIKFKNSILLGDSDTDIIAENIGVKAVKVSLEYSLSDWTREFLLK